MSYSIIPTDNFNREAKQLLRKHRSRKDDLRQLRADLTSNPTLGTHMGGNVYKIRMAIASKGKGKSGGARIISHVYVKGEMVFLMTIYDKSDKANVTESEIKTSLKSLPVI